MKDRSDFFGAILENTMNNFRFIFQLRKNIQMYNDRDFIHISFLCKGTTEIKNIEGKNVAIKKSETVSFRNVRRRKKVELWTIRRKKCLWP